MDESSTTPILSLTGFKWGDTINEKPESDPEEAGKLFDGWWTTASTSGGHKLVLNETRVHSNMIFYPHLSNNLATIHWNSNGGTPVDDSVVTLNSRIGELPSTSRTGYTFNGWFDSNRTEIDENTTIIEDKTFIAHWSENTYTIKFFDGHELIKTIYKKHNQRINDDEFPVLEPNDGYNLLGWFTGENGEGNRIDSNYQVTSDLMVYSHWGLNTYIVRFKYQD